MNVHVCVKMALAVRSCLSVSSDVAHSERHPRYDSLTWIIANLLIMEALEYVMNDSARRKSYRLSINLAAHFIFNKNVIKFRKCTFI